MTLMIGSSWQLVRDWPGQYLHFLRCFWKRMIKSISGHYNFSSFFWLYVGFDFHKCVDLQESSTRQCSPTLLNQFLQNLHPCSSFSYFFYSNTSYICLPPSPTSQTPPHPPPSRSHGSLFNPPPSLLLRSHTTINPLLLYSLYQPPKSLLFF